MRHWRCALFRKKNGKEHKTEADATPHLRLQGNASVFHLNLFSRGQNTEETGPGKAPWSNKTYSTMKTAFINSVHSDLMCVQLQ